MPQLQAQGREQLTSADKSQLGRPAPFPVVWVLGGTPSFSFWLYPRSELTLLLSLRDGHEECVGFAPSSGQMSSTLTCAFASSPGTTQDVPCPRCSHWSPGETLSMAIPRK